MARYIDADALKGKTIGIEWCDETKTLIFHEHIDDDAPTANVAPIADTVKKMQEKLKAKAYTNNYCQEVVLLCDIDQIAKEMLEGNNEVQ